MTIHPDVTERHLKIVGALKMAVPSSRQTETGYIAKARVSAAALSDALKDNLQEILVGEWTENRETFSSLVCNNNEEPIEFKTENEAMDQARQLTDSLVRRYCYGLYAAYGIVVKPEEQAGATLHFFRGGRP